MSGTVTQPSAQTSPRLASQCASTGYATIADARALKGSPGFDARLSCFMASGTVANTLWCDAVAKSTLDGGTLR
jgi:hypothetical protein